MLHSFHNTDVIASWFGHKSYFTAAAHVMIARVYPRVYIRDKVSSFLHTHSFCAPLGKNIPYLGLT